MFVNTIVCLMKFITSLSSCVSAVLVRGSCVVNEAMLTGESVPQVKESLRQAAAGEAADGFKRFTVFAGTSLVQHISSAGSGAGGADQDSGSGGGVKAPPDGGCVAVVVRTGFETQQGGLMRKILFSSERVTENSAETFRFIGILLFFACVSSFQVLRVGLFDESRNKFKLVLHCIMIVTSVVPPVSSVASRR
jgi:cation-transporting ATPase 13A1